MPPVQTVLPTLSALHDSPDFSKVLASKYTRLHVCLEDADHANLLLHLEETSSFITQVLQGGSRVLVHCAAGISRSATASFHAHNLIVNDATSMVIGNPHLLMQLPACLSSSMFNESCELWGVLWQAYSLIANIKTPHHIPLTAGCSAALHGHLM